MEYSAVLIPVDVTEPIRRVNVRNSLEHKQELVNGDIEALDFEEFPGITFYINEEGKYTEERNNRATALLGPGLFAGDSIHGPLLIMAWDYATDTYSDLPAGWEDEHTPASIGAARSLPEPVIERKDRSVTFLWRLYEHDEGTEYAVLSCHHQTAGTSMLSGRSHGNEFFSVLSTETRRDEGGFQVRSMIIGSGVGILTEEVTRFNAKRFALFAEQARAKLERHWALSDPQVTKYFADPKTGGVIEFAEAA